MSNPIQYFTPRPNHNPTIYAYSLPDALDKKDLLKIGYTDRDANTRIKEQIGTTHLKYKLHLEESAMLGDGGNFTDHDVHKMLRSMDKENPQGEWFKCSVDDIQTVLNALRRGDKTISHRTQDFAMRPEQKKAVEKTIHYFNNIAKEQDNRTPHFLWNAKMRFGKTFTTYQLAKKMGWSKILILTFKPAVKDAWQDDLNNHIDFENWQFISRDTDLTYDGANKSNPIVCFGSFQDYLGKNKAGGIKTKNEWVHTINWDCVIFDEYHYGAWRDSAKGLTEDNSQTSKDKYDDFESEIEIPDYFQEDNLPITTNHYLYLSGTPFRAIESGEFIEEQIYNWTYSDEQKAKKEWVGDNNPYLSLPRMIMMTYQLPDSIIDIAKEGEFNEFDLNTFFKAEGEGEEAKFKYQDDVQKWLDLIRGSYLETSKEHLKIGHTKPALPFSHTDLLNILSHTLWFLPRVNSCFAMKNLLEQKQNKFYHDYKVIVVAGNKAGQGADAVNPVREQMGDPLKTKTITLTCGKLTTGVSVKPWTGIFMLRKLSSPESYFQSAFRVQTPWVIKNPDDKSPNKTEILKKNCYVFDFAPNRALKQIADYSCRLSIDESNPEKKVQDFINFLPVLAYDGGAMKSLDASNILDMALSGTSATLLAKRWESNLLVNVDNRTGQVLNSVDRFCC